MARIIQSEFNYTRNPVLSLDNLSVIVAKIRSNLERVITELGGHGVNKVVGRCYPTPINYSMYEFPDGGTTVGVSIYKRKNELIVLTEVNMLGSDRLWQPGNELPGTDLVDRIVFSLITFPEGNEIIFDAITRQTWKNGLIPNFEPGTYMPAPNPPGKDWYKP